MICGAEFRAERRGGREKGDLIGMVHGLELLGVVDRWVELVASLQHCVSFVEIRLRFVIFMLWQEEKEELGSGSEEKEESSS
jgi:hypothetical protein